MNKLDKEVDLSHFNAKPANLHVKNDDGAFMIDMTGKSMSSRKKIIYIIIIIVAAAAIYIEWRYFYFTPDSSVPIDNASIMDQLPNPNTSVPVEKTP